MALVVQKFGGSSLETADDLRRAAARAVAEAEAGDEVVVVVSARGRGTDVLIALAREIHPEPDPRELDMLVAVGEQMSSALMAIAIHTLDHDAISLTGAQAGIRTDSVSSKARIQRIDTSRLRQELAKGRIVIVAGFQGVDEQDNITTLGRGGSDTTAVALAATLKADRCDIFTDVEGIYTADPRIVPEARKLDVIDCDEMLELASLGARVMHSRAVEIAKRFGVSFRVRPSYSKSEGTLVTNLTENVELIDVRGAALDKDQAKITIQSVPDRPGVAATIFGELARNQINVDMIVQNVSAEGATDVSFTVVKSDLSRALRVSRDLARRLGAGTVDADENVAKLSVVGVGMKSHCGIAAKMFGALAENEVNIRMISTSEIKISCVINGSEGEKALKAMHQAFELDKG